jgi:ABC-type branched-subunit amino acid transport system ATPase component
MAPLLEVKNINRHFGGLHAVNNVTFNAGKGAITGVIGPNGAGKTTLFNCIAGSTRPDSGSITFDGKSIFAFPPHRIAEAGITRTFQNLKIFGHMSVLENVMLGLHRLTHSGVYAAMLRTPGLKREERFIRDEALACLDVLGIKNLADSPAGGLSFGQQRAVEFARALAAKPALLLLDEPAAGLNMHETKEVGQLIKKVNARGLSILIVEHDMELIMGISDHLVVLSQGAVIAQGTPREIQKNPDVIRIYLGDDDAHGA